jgi:REP element-mobilizing transposase RayT
MQSEMEIQKPHARNLRKGRFSEAGRAYHVTTATVNREPVFWSLPAARQLINTLHQEQRLGRALTYAFVVMPDHLHWLFQLGAGQTLSEVIEDIKSVSSRRIAGLRWQPGFYDHGLRGEEDIKELARYIVANPLRAGLVDHIGDYPHWDAIWL